MLIVPVDREIVSKLKSVMTLNKKVYRNLLPHFLKLMHETSFLFLVSVNY